ncbi:uncharacterized protein LOC124313491 [Daphnia pulicaria]|uniref:uncharacterized protein LOC124313491 n=1 Tax=Daphnia pulicaria TaxID=35523 RepID=UPI001EECBE95|nr:uncharacterized protein LOC124313491 [Daphnia pulicaria]
MLSLNNIRISLSKISFPTDLKRIAISMLTKCSHAFTSPFFIICHVMTPIVEASHLARNSKLSSILQLYCNACFVDGESQVKLRTLSRHYILLTIVSNFDNGFCFWMIHFKYSPELSSFLCPYLSMV